MLRPLTLASIAAALALAPSLAYSAGHCADGKTISPGVLTIATGNPAYFPWVIDDNPESGEGFEAAVAYAIADRLGFGQDEVQWVRSGFDESIQPGAKNFDFNLQQFSITSERDVIVDFSAPYYHSAMAVVVRQTTVDAGAEATMGSLKTLKWGAAASTTAVPMLTDQIAPDSDPLLYNDTADTLEAMKAGQIDAALFDLPTALFVTAVLMDDGVVLGQFPADRAENPDMFGLLLEEGNALKSCLDEAIAGLAEDGTLAEIEAMWLSETTGVPVIQ